MPLLARPGARFVRYRQVPGDGVLLQSQRLAKAADGVEYVDPEPDGDALVDEQPVQVLRARAVVADAPLRRPERRQQVGARGDLHPQQRARKSVAEGKSVLVRVYSGGRGTVRKQECVNKTNPRILYQK